MGSKDDLLNGLDLGNLDLGSMDLGELDLGNLDLGNLDAQDGGLNLDLGSLDLGLGDDVANDGGNVGYQEPAKPAQVGPSIPAANKYQKEQGFLEHTLGALDYLGNASRSGLAGMKTNQGWENLKQALAKRRSTSPEQLRKTYGWGNVGKDDGNFQAGDLVDFGSDVITGAVTDPLSLVSMGLGRAAKGTGALAKSIQAAKLGEASTFATAKNVAQPALGALYGLGTQDADSTPLEKIGAAAAGAAVVGVGGKIAAPILKRAVFGGKNASAAVEKIASSLEGSSPKAAEFLRGSDDAQGVFDKLVDSYGARTKIADDMGTLEFHTIKGAAEKGIKNPKLLSKTLETAGEGAQAKSEIVRRISEGELEHLTKLSPEEQVTVTDFMRKLKDSNIKLRDTFVDNDLAHRGITAADRAAETPEFIQAFHGATNDANDYVKMIAKDEWDRFIKDQNIKIGADKFETVQKMMDYNQNHIKAYNQHILNDTGKAGSSAGLIAHFPEIYPDSFDPKEFGKVAGIGPEATNREVSDLLKHQQARMVSEDKSVPLGFDPNLSAKEKANQRIKGILIYANKEANKFLTKEHRQALSDAQRYRNSGSMLLKGFDRVTGFVKGNILLGSTTWHLHNYWDNLGKAYMENGLEGAIKSGSFGAFQKNLSKDVWNIMAGRLDRKILDQSSKDALKYGALDGPMFKALDDSYQREFFSTAKSLQNRNLLTKTVDWYEGALRRTSGQVGSYIEGMARSATFKHNVELLSKSMKGTAPDQIKTMAAKLVNDTYFDFGNISHFESAIMKRMIPFYSFYRHNLPYWAKSMVDVEKVGRLANIQRFRDEFGKPLNENDRKGLPEYIANKAPRSLGRNKFGTGFAFAPAFSFDDAINQMGGGEGLKKELQEKGHPIAKTAYELLSGDDLFAGGNLYPSDEKSGKKHLFSRGFKYKFYQDALDAALGTKESLGVHVDKKGSPITTSDALVGLDKASQLFMPAPFGGMADKLASSVGKIQSGKEAPIQSIANQLSPIQEVNVSDAQKWSGYRREQAKVQAVRAKELKLLNEKRARLVNK